MHEQRIRSYWTPLGLVAGAAIGVLVAALTAGSLALLIALGAGFGLVVGAGATMLTPKPESPAQNALRVTTDESVSGRTSAKKSTHE